MGIFGRLADGIYRVETPSFGAVTIKVGLAKSGRRVARVTDDAGKRPRYVGYGIDTSGQIDYSSWTHETEPGLVRIVAAGTVLHDMPDPDAAGVAFAAATGRCCRCRRTLTNPESVARGYGPECALVVTHQGVAVAADAAPCGCDGNGIRALADYGYTPCACPAGETVAASDWTW